MASLNFPPATPGVPGPEYTLNGIVYYWDGEKWTANNEDGFTDVFVNVDGDNMTGDLTVPNLESTGDVQMASQNGGPLAGFRNQLINGDFRVWQRGNAITFSGDVGYHADRWYTGEPAGTVSKISKYGGIPVCECSATRYIQQGIELPLDENGESDPGPFTVGSTWTLSYYSTVEPAGGPEINIQFRDRVSGGNEEDVSANVPDLTATGETLGSGNELVRYSTTFTVTGTPSVSNRCLVIHCTGNAGGPQTGQDFAYAQLEPGPVATPFEHRPISTELALCQRYYLRLGGAQYLKVGSITCTSGTENIHFAHISTPVNLRGTPTISLYQIYTVKSGKFLSPSDITINGNSANGVSMDITVSTGLSEFQTDGIQTQLPDGYMAFDAEL